MTSPDVERNQFNRLIDDMITRAVMMNLISREYTVEYVKAANLCRRVAEFDPQLAFELLVSGIMLSYTAGMAVIRRS